MGEQAHSGKAGGVLETLAQLIFLCMFRQEDMFSLSLHKRLNARDVENIFFTTIPSILY